MTKGARILLALVAEDTGDLDGALEQYLLLDYKEDAAYFIDVLMSPEQLAAFIASHPQAAQLNELNYALGVRYLRSGRYAESLAPPMSASAPRAETVILFELMRVI